MSLINDRDLEYMRAAIGELLPGTAILLTLTQTSDGQGGFTEAWGTVSGGTVACRLDYKRGVEVVSGDALNPYTGWMVTLPHGTTITEQYRVEIASTQYNVTAVDNGKSWSAAVRVAVEKA